MHQWIRKQTWPLPCLTCSGYQVKTVSRVQELEHLTIIQSSTSLVMLELIYQLSWRMVNCRDFSQKIKYQEAHYLVLGPVFQS
jgi:hypothetical protein